MGSRPSVPVRLLTPHQSQRPSVMALASIVVRYLFEFIVVQNYQKKVALPTIRTLKFVKIHSFRLSVLKFSLLKKDACEQNEEYRSSHLKEGCGVECFQKTGVFCHEAAEQNTEPHAQIP